MEQVKPKTDTETLLGELREKADGLTNCTETIQKIISVQSKVFLEPGTYKLNGTLVLKDGQSLQGIQH